MGVHGDAPPRNTQYLCSHLLKLSPDKDLFGADRPGCQSDPLSLLFLRRDRPAAPSTRKYEPKKEFEGQASGKAGGRSALAICRLEIRMRWLGGAPKSEVPYIAGPSASTKLVRLPEAGPKDIPVSHGPCRPFEVQSLQSAHLPFLKQEAQTNCPHLLQRWNLSFTSSQAASFAFFWLLTLV